MIILYTDTHFYNILYGICEDVHDTAVKQSRIRRVYHTVGFHTLC